MNWPAWEFSVVVFVAVLFLAVFIWIAASFEKIAKILSSGVVNVKDVERAKVYSQHLGEKLRQ